MTEAKRNAARAAQFAGSAIEKVCSGGRKKKLKQSVAATDAAVPSSRPSQIEISRTTIRKTKPIVDGFSVSREPTAVTIARAAIAPSQRRMRTLLV